MRVEHRGDDVGEQQKPKGDEHQPAQKACAARLGGVGLGGRGVDGHARSLPRRGPVRQRRGDAA